MNLRRLNAPFCGPSKPHQPLGVLVRFAAGARQISQCKLVLSLCITSPCPSFHGALITAVTGVKIGNEATHAHRAQDDLQHSMFPYAIQK
jgi:hypothetical protein